MRYLILALTLIAVKQTYAQSIENMWRARGIEAEKFLEDYNDKTRAEKASPKIKCQLILEMGLALLTDPKAPGVSSFKYKSKTQKSILLYLKANNKSVGLTFAYEDDGKIPTMVMPVFYDGASNDGWSAVLSPRSPSGTFSLQNSGCVYHFNAKDYLNPVVETVSK